MLSTKRLNSLPGLSGSGIRNNRKAKGMDFVEALFMIFIGAVFCYGVYKACTVSANSNIPKDRETSSINEKTDQHTSKIQVQINISDESKSTDPKDEFQCIVDHHFELNTKIKELYSQAREDGYNSEAMNTVIDLCKQDIALATCARTYWVLEAEEFGQKGDPMLPRYPSFQQLAIIYEKQGKYHEAIRVYERAIQLSFT